VGPSAYRVFSERHAKGKRLIEESAGDYIGEALERGGTGWRDLSKCVGIEEAAVDRLQRSVTLCAHATPTTVIV
jgi:hypothetical protein